MSNLNALFQIVDEKGCPLYNKGERLVLSEKTLSCPEGKEVCLILVRDMTQLLFSYLQGGDDALNADRGIIHNCSGCKGLIKFSLVPPGDSTATSDTRLDRIGARIDSALNLRIGRALHSPFLRTIPEEMIDLVLDSFQVVEIAENTTLIRKGKLNLNLYILIDGMLTVESESGILGTIIEGEICGEMSYLGADKAIATVRSQMPSRLLAIEGQAFGELLGHNSDVQAYMANLLADRLRTSHQHNKSQNADSCMSGRLGDILPAELFQVFHMHQKTGVLRLQFPGGASKVAFREGEIINASYNNLKNEDAVFRILGEKKGQYEFTAGLSPQEMTVSEIGDFMMLLMEGIRRVDEGF